MLPEISWPPNDTVEIAPLPNRAVTSSDARDPIPRAALQISEDSDEVFLVRGEQKMSVRWHHDKREQQEIPSPALEGHNIENKIAFSRR